MFSSLYAFGKRLIIAFNIILFNTIEVISQVILTPDTCLIHYVHNDTIYTLATRNTDPTQTSTKCLISCTVDTTPLPSVDIELISRFLGPDFGHIPLMDVTWSDLIGGRGTIIQLVYISHGLLYQIDMNMNEQINTMATTTLTHTLASMCNKRTLKPNTSD